MIAKGSYRIEHTCSVIGHIYREKSGPRKGWICFGTHRAAPVKSAVDGVWDKSIVPVQVIFFSSRRLTHPQADVKAGGTLIAIDLPTSATALQPVR